MIEEVSREQHISGLDPDVKLRGECVAQLRMGQPSDILIDVCVDPTFRCW